MSKSKSWVLWTPEEDAALREVWASRETLKQNAHRFGAHSMAAIRERCRALKLGRRPVPVRSQYSAIWEAARNYLANVGPADLFELSEALDLPYESLSTALKAAWKREPLHVHGYIKRKKNGPPGRVWALGKGRNAPRPKAIDQREFNQRDTVRQRIKRVREANPISPDNPMAFLVQQAVFSSMAQGRS